MARGPVGHTCPKIDDCISRIEAVVDGRDGYSVLSDLIGRKGALEEIRFANEALREWGAENEDRVEELEGDVARLERVIEDLRDEVKSTKEQLEEA